jgi:hypothetical protein
MAALGHHDPKDYAMTYPEPPHYSTTMDLGLSPEPYSAYPRASHEYATTMGYENGAVYAETPYMYSNNTNSNKSNNHSGRASPGMYPEDGDVGRGPASDLSIASASSSNMGSPLSSHGQMAPIPEWATAPHGLGVTPGIVDQCDYFPGEYSFAPGGIDAFNAPYDFPDSKAPGFVGELAQIPRSSPLSPPSSSSHTSGHTHRGSISSPIPCDSRSTLVGLGLLQRPPSSAAGLALDTRLAQQSLAPTSVPSSTVTSGVLLTPPTTSTASFVSCSSSSHTAWSSPPAVGYRSPARPATPGSRLVPPFFSQSSGHFVPPLHSCWFPLSHLLSLSAQ